MADEFRLWAQEDISEPLKEKHLCYVRKYVGNNYDKAISLMCELKRKGSKSVKLEWNDKS